MSVIVPVRAFNRSQKVRVGGKTLGPATTYINLDNKRVARDLARHTTLGALIQSGAAFWRPDDGVVDSGGEVTAPTPSLTLVVAAINATRASGAVVDNVADTIALAAAHATLPRIDTVALDTSGAGDIVKVDGTATAGANRDNLVGLGAVAANNIVLAYAIQPGNSAAGAVEADDDVVTLAAHGYTVGQALRLVTLTGGTGLTANTVYYVIGPVTTNTFKLSATLGGASVAVTVDGTALLFNTGPVVVEARP